MTLNIKKISIVLIVPIALLAIIFFILNLSYLNEKAENYSKLIEAFDIFATLAISGAILWLSSRASRIAKASEKETAYRIRSNEIKNFRKNLNKVESVINEIIGAGMHSEYSLNELNNAKKEADLFLPREIGNYISKLITTVSKTPSIAEIRKKNLKEQTKTHRENLDSLKLEKPVEIYRKYLIDEKLR